MKRLKVKLILELRDQGLSRSEISSSRHISRRNVNEVLEQGADSGTNYPKFSGIGFGNSKYESSQEPIKSI